MAFGVKKDTASAEVKSIEASLKQVEDSKKRMVYQLGELFYGSMIGTLPLRQMQKTHIT